MDDQFIINQVFAGNTAAFKVLVLRYQRPIFKFLKSFFLSDQVIEELAQETFLRAFKNLERFDPEKASFSSWLFTIAKNAAINETKKERRSLPSSQEDITKLADAKSSSTFVDKHTHETDKKKLALAISQLPDIFRRAVSLSYLQELSLEDIAAIEGCSVGTVKSRIFRGKQILKDAFFKGSLEVKI